MDCLDRTNVFQAKQALQIFEIQVFPFFPTIIFKMEYLSIKLADLTKRPVLELLDESDFQGTHPFFKKFKHMWADNGDMISKHYSGTGSTHTSAVKEGKSNLKTFFKAGSVSVRRFFKGNFQDTRRQTLFDLFRGQHIETEDPF